MKFKSKETLGIIFAIIAYFSFSILDAVQKTAVIHYSIFQLLFIKYILNKDELTESNMIEIFKI